MNKTIYFYFEMCYIDIILKEKDYDFNNNSYYRQHNNK